MIGLHYVEQGIYNSLIGQRRVSFECDDPTVFHIILDQLYAEHRSMPNVLLHSTCPVPVFCDFLNHIFQFVSI